MSKNWFKDKAQIVAKYSLAYFQSVNNDVCHEMYRIRETLLPFLVLVGHSVCDAVATGHHSTEITLPRQSGCSTALICLLGLPITKANRRVRYPPKWPVYPKLAAEMLDK